MSRPIQIVQRVHGFRPGDVVGAQVAIITARMEIERELHKLGQRADPTKGRILIAHEDEITIRQAMHDFWDFANPPSISASAIGDFGRLPVIPHLGIPSGMVVAEHHVRGI